ncbi:AMP-binding protein, partial [candidate division WOR-3 bacterium]|nr:AMP-binding protein [candidate division WOR-3 bacterium]
MADTLYRAFAEVAARFAERPALMHKVEGTYHAVTYAQLSRAVDETAAGLAQRDVRPGSRVAIYSYNRPEWVVADLAAVKLGAEVVPVYHTLPADSVGYILRDAGVSHLFVENEELLAVVTGLLPGLPGLECVVTFSDRPAGPGTGPGIISLASLRADGAAALGRDPAAGAAHPARSGDLLTICYTSGTTGEPKGTMLTHANVMSNVAGAINLAGVNEQDVLVSFLPLCHMFERTCGYYTMLLAGACIAYAETVQTVAQDVRLVRPTVLIVVPRVLEKVYNTVTERVLAGSQLQRRLMVATLRSHTRCARLRQRGLRAPPSLALARWFTGLLVVRKLRRLGGGRIRLIFSGAAPLEKRLANVFRALGFNLLEGYGLTETSPVACAAVPGQERVGTV